MKKPIFVLSVVCFVGLFGCSEESVIQPGVGSETSMLQKNSRNISGPVAVSYDENRKYGYPVVSTNQQETSRTVCDGIESDVFILTHFFPQASECYEEIELVTALINAGESFLDATARATIIFHTAHTSPEYMGETASIIGPLEFPGSSGSYTGSFFDFLDNGDCLDGCIPAPLPGGQAYNGCAPGTISLAQHLHGNSGNAALGDPNGSWIRISSTCGPSFSEFIEFDIADVEAVLTPQQWSDLLMGNFTEREFWNLYQQEVVPSLQQYRNAIDQTIPQCYVLNEAGFRANYIVNNTAGFSHYAIEGNGRLYCGPIN